MLKLDSRYPNLILLRKIKDTLEALSQNEEFMKAIEENIQESQQMDRIRQVEDDDDEFLENQRKAK